MEIPDDLYRKVKAKSAMQGRAVREVTTELYRHWLTEDQPPPRRPTPEEWLEEWISLGEELLRDAPVGPTATDIIAADRNRLESTEPC